MKTRKNPITMLAITFSLIGIPFLLFGIGCIVYGQSSGRNYTEVEAVITDFDKYRDSDGDTHRSFVVSYEYEGESFADKNLNYYSSGYGVGDTISIQVNKENPSQVRVKGFWLMFGGVFALVAVIFVIISGVMFVIAGRQKARKERLLTGGHYITAEIYNITRNPLIRINGRHPFIIECRYEDRYTDKQYLFSSESLFADPSLFYEIGEQINVYVGDDTYKEYYVDTGKMEEGIVDYR